MAKRWPANAGLARSRAGDQYYGSVLEDIELEGRDFQADSWSAAVDSGYLQAHRKDVIKRQDVIYGEQRPDWAGPPSMAPPPRPGLSGLQSPFPSVGVKGLGQG